MTSPQSTKIGCVFVQCLYWMDCGRGFRFVFQVHFDHMFHAFSHSSADFIILFPQECLVFNFPSNGVPRIRLPVDLSQTTIPPVSVHRHKLYLSRTVIKCIPNV